MDILRQPLCMQLWPLPDTGNIKIERSVSDCANACAKNETQATFLVAAGKADSEIRCLCSIGSPVKVSLVTGNLCSIPCIQGTASDNEQYRWCGGQSEDLWSLYLTGNTGAVLTARDRFVSMPESRTATVLVAVGVILAGTFLVVALIGSFFRRKKPERSLTGEDVPTTAFSLPRRGRSKSLNTARLQVHPIDTHLSTPIPNMPAVLPAAYLADARTLESFTPATLSPSNDDISFNKRNSSHQPFHYVEHTLPRGAGQHRYMSESDLYRAHHPPTIVEHAVSSTCIVNGSDQGSQTRSQPTAQLFLPERVASTVHEAVAGVTSTVTDLVTMTSSTIQHQLQRTGDALLDEYLQLLVSVKSPEPKLDTNHPHQQTIVSDAVVTSSFVLGRQMELNPDEEAEASALEEDDLVFRNQELERSSPAPSSVYMHMLLVTEAFD